MGAGNSHTEGGSTDSAMSIMERSASQVLLLGFGYHQLSVRDSLASMSASESFIFDRPVIKIQRQLGSLAKISYGLIVSFKASSQYLQRYDTSVDWRQALNIF